MNLVYPDYYPEFKCIADACKHSCCIGWEIDIDPESANRFASIPAIVEHIESADPPFFRLSDSGKCPFLESSGLCRMILTYGEEMLCDICKDHPRFRNPCGNTIELGLGL